MRYFWNEMRFQVAVALVRFARRLMPPYRQRLFLFHRDNKLYEVMLRGSESDEILDIVGQLAADKEIGRPKVIH